MKTIFVFIALQVTFVLSVHVDSERGVRNLLFLLVVLVSINGVLTHLLHKQEMRHCTLVALATPVFLVFTYFSTFNNLLYLDNGNGLLIDLPTASCGRKVESFKDVTIFFLFFTK